MLTPVETSLLAPWHTALAVAPALLAAAAATAASFMPEARSAWRAARWGSVGGLGAALAVLVALAIVGPGQHTLWRSDAVGAVVGLLVAFIGWVIVRYSQPYLAGEPGEAACVRWLMATLAAVLVVVASNNLLVLALAWMASSLALHRLLLFFGERPAARIAAHKKYLAARAADLCMAGAVGLLYLSFGTLQIDTLLAQAGAATALPAPAAWAVGLIVLAASALLKCAQLPVHGWLIQVMEAPTPVSALLHAGVVNLGGFVLIRVGALVADVPAAQALLVVVGSLTAVVAALVAMTRISIKVALAWSTSAQMGFMLMQCGLGLHELALLHLVAHSLYKAHAFLAAGTAVEHNRLHQMTPAEPVPGLRAWLLGALAGLALVALAALAWGLTAAAAPGLWALMFILALALVPLLTGTARRAEGLWPLAGPAAAFALALAYFGLHAAFGHILGNASDVAPAGWALAGSVMVCFLALFVVQGTLRARPQGALARRLYPALFAGLYLDELFTRLTFRVWPARLPAPPAARTQSQTSTTGVATEI